MAHPPNIPLRDTAAVAVSAALFVAYHAFIFIKLRSNPTYTIQATNSQARTMWVEFIMADSSRALLGVQTLRNSTMAATFFASTAVLMMIGVLNMAAQSERLITALHLGDPQRIIGSTVWTIKILMMVAIFFVAFFAFALSVRLLNHVGYLIVECKGGEGQSARVSAAARYLKRSGVFYTVGMRAYYIAVPLVFWLFGPELLVASTAILVVALYGIDRAPKERRTQPR